MTQPSLLMIGCGNMGGALLKGWLNAPISQRFARIDVVKPSPPSAELDLAGVTFHSSYDAIKHTPSLVIWAVKPYQFAEVIPASVQHFGRDAAYISIAAGKTLADMAHAAGAEDYKMIRSMPNTPTAIGRGVTGLCASANVPAEDKELAGALFASVGSAEWIDEAHMNALTALCGSGPAYVYYFMECLTAAATEMGLGPEQADALARQTVFGTAAMAANSSLSLAELRRNVTSPGGTTAAALDVWMKPGTLDAQAKQALQAAAARAVALETDS